MGKSGLNKSPARRLGILGGSFDPVHLWHLLMAQAAWEGMRLEKVIFIPACCSPLKTDRKLAGPKDRLSMVKEAIKGQPHFTVSDCEIKRGGLSYSVDTLKYFRQQYPLHRLYWIIGADSLKTLPHWKDIGTLRKLASFIVVDRPGHPKTRFGFKVFNALMPKVDISSSDIRRRVKAGKSVRYMTPDGVCKYIFKKKLYTSSNTPDKKGPYERYAQ
jgi:nicotinate-nucleotide adenylyltransferase